MLGGGIGKHSEELPLLSYFFDPLQLPEPLLQESNGGRMEACRIIGFADAVFPHGHGIKIQTECEL